MPRSFKESINPYIGLIPSEWKEIKNRYLFVHDKIIVKEKYKETQLLSLTTKGIVKKDIESNEGKMPSDFGTYQEVKKDQVVLCLFDLDCSAVFSGVSSYDGMISPAYKVVSCTDRILPRFAEYWFENIGNRRSYMYHSKSLRYTINDDMFKDIYTCVPSIEEQLKIISLLDDRLGKADIAISKIEEEIDSLIKLKKSAISKEMFGPNSEKWNQTKLLNLLSMKITDGPHETPVFVDEGIPFISAEAIYTGRIDFDHKRGNITQEYYEECCKKYIPKVNDIYMVKSGGTTGNLAIVDTNEIFTIWSPLAAIRVNNKNYYKFVYYYLFSAEFQYQIALNWSYGTQQNIGMRTLEQMQIRYPDFETQKKIADSLDAQLSKVDELIALKRQKIVFLKKYKESFLYSVITGKKEVF